MLLSPVEGGAVFGGAAHGEAKALAAGRSRPAGLLTYRVARLDVAALRPVDGFIRRSA